MNHKIWNYIQLENENWFTVYAILHIEWQDAWTYTLKSHCYYNVVTNECYDAEETAFNGKGEIVNQWVEFLLPKNDLFENDDVFKVISPIIVRDSNE